MINNVCKKNIILKQVIPTALADCVLNDRKTLTAKTGNMFCNQMQLQISISLAISIGNYNFRFSVSAADS